MRLNSNRLWSGIILLVTVALSTVSCNRNTIYSHYEAIDALGWLREDTLHFEVVPSEVPHAEVVPSEVSHAEAGTGLAGRRDVALQPTLGLRVTSSYPFTDLVLDVRLTTRSQHRQALYRLQLADSEGTTRGSGSGLYQHDFPLSGITLASDDTLHVAVSHYMQQSPLPGITDVGMTISLR